MVKYQMKKIPLFLAISLLSSPLFALDETITPPKTEKGAEQISINGDTFSKLDFQIYARSRLATEKGKVSDDRAKEMIRDLVGIVLMAQDAKANGFDKDPEIQQALRLANYQILSQAGLIKYIKTHPITEAEKEKTYQVYLSKRPTAEYHIYNIQTKTEAEAQDAIKKLTSGTDFKTLAKEISIDPSSKVGGDLGWYTPKSNSSEFAKAILALEVGSYTQKPVHSEFGWHILLVQQKRKLTPVAKEKILPQIETLLKKGRMNEYLLELNKTAKIKMFDTEGKEVSLKP